MTEGPVDLKAFEERPTRRRRRAAQTIAPVEHPSGDRDAAGESETGDRIVIVLSEERTNQNIRKVAALQRDDIVMRGPMPMMLVRIDDPAGLVADGVSHAQGLPVLVGLTPGLVQFRVDNRFLFRKLDGRKNALVDKCCPPSFASKIIDAAADLGFYQCTGIVTAPVFSGGKLIVREGFDRRTGLYQAYRGKVRTIAKRPSKADAQRALEVALRPFVGYLAEEYLSGEERQVLLASLAAAVLTAALRASLRRAPVILLDANTPAAGKGKAGKALAVIAIGCLPSLITEGPDPAELEKRLAAALLSGTGAMMLDNLQRQLRSSTLESIVTEGYATIRNFGTLGSITVPANSLILITANNLALRHDMLRRTLTVRLIVKTDTPERRRFDFDPFDRAAAERDAILEACFTIARAWELARDLPENEQIRAKSLGSFEEWSGLVGAAVEWLTGLHPADLIEQRKTADTGRGTELRAISALLEWQNGAWNAQNGTHPWRAKDALEGVEAEVWAEVLRAKRGDTPSPRDLGDFLRFRRDQVFSIRDHLEEHYDISWMLTGKQDRKGVVRWRLIQLEHTSLPPGQAGHAGSSIWNVENCQNTEELRRGSRTHPAAPGVTRHEPGYEVEL